MRAISLWAAAAAFALCARPVIAATYSTDTSYQFTGQTGFNSGDGLAVNSSNTRLYTVIGSSSSGGVLILDTATGTQVGSITPPTPTLIRDVAISPDGATLYYIRDTSTSSTLEYAPASDGDHGPAEVTAIDAGPTASDPGDTPFTGARSLAVAASGGDLYIGVAGTSNFYIYKKPAGGAWSQEITIPLSFTSQRRDTTVADTGSGSAFYVLTPGGASAPVVQSFDLAGTARSVSFSAPPASFQGYFWDSITSAGTIDGETSLFVAGDTIDNDFNSRLTAFRYNSTGSYAGDGFGYGLSPTAPLNALATLGESSIIAPAASAGSTFYIGAVNPDEFGGGPQYVRVEISGGATGPGSISGTVNTSGNLVEGAQVVVSGQDAPVDSTEAAGTFALSPLNAGTYTISASKFGYIAASASVSLAAGEQKTGVDITLPGTVPTFELGHVFAPPITDGQIFPGEYNSPAMPLFTLGGAEPAPEVAATAWITQDSQNLYVAVSAGEPSLALNSASWSNQNMLTLDDSVQIYVDPAHRHAAPGNLAGLYQFAVNIPPVIGGQPNGTPQLIQRRINPHGSLAQPVDSSTWFARAGYTDTGWMLEARISLDAFAPFAPPDADSVWGLLIGRNRPDTHRDSLPTLYSTSPAQAGTLTNANTWTDATFEAAATGVAGDVNENGVVDMSDALYALRMAAGLSFGTPNPADPYGGDPNVTIRQGIYARGNVWPVTPDTAITIEDALALLRAATGTAPL